MGFVLSIFLVGVAGKKRRFLMWFEEVEIIVSSQGMVDFLSEHVSCQVHVLDHLVKILDGKLKRKLQHLENHVDLISKLVMYATVSWRFQLHI